MTHPAPPARFLSLPDVSVEVVEDLTPPAPNGFMRLVRRRLVLRYADGTRSEPFLYDEVDRKALDAVVIAAHYRDEGATHVYLRSALRPPVALREAKRSPDAESVGRVALWELPAGLVEPEDQDPAGIFRTAQRELREELGFAVPVDRLRRLGPSTFPAPGFVAECHYFFSVAVTPERRGAPTLDGSVLERAGIVVGLPLNKALELCASGEIADAKTELGLRRLRETLA